MMASLQQQPIQIDESTPTQQSPPQITVSQAAIPVVPTTTTTSPQKRKKRTPEEIQRDNEEREEKRRKREADKLAAAALKEQKEKEKQEKLKAKEIEKQKKEAEKAKKEAEIAAKKKEREEAHRLKEEKDREREEAAKRKAEEEEKKKNKTQTIDKLFQFSSSTTTLKPLKTDKQSQQQQKHHHQTTCSSASTTEQQQASDLIIVGNFREYELPIGATMYKPWIRPSWLEPPLSSSDFDSLLQSQSFNHLSLLDFRRELLKHKGYQRRNQKKQCEKRRKVLLFHENQRPPFRGIWPTNSNIITGRHPFAKDPQFEYEYDSGIEWDNEPEGDDIQSNDEDDDEDEEEEEEELTSQGEEAKFVVPDGYLSAEEGIGAEGTTTTTTIVKMISTTPENGDISKQQQQQPEVFGIIFDLEKVVGERERTVLMSLPVQIIAGIVFDDGRIQAGQNNDSTTNTTTTAKGSPSKKSAAEEQVFPESAVIALAKLINEKTRFTLTEISELFHSKMPELSVRCIEKKIHEIAIQKHRHWSVKGDLLDRSSASTIKSLFSSVSTISKQQSPKKQPPQQPQPVQIQQQQ